MIRLSNSYLPLLLVLLVTLNGLQALSQQPQGVEAAFCSNLAAIIRAGGDNFRSIRGASDPDSGGSGWASTVTLPGASECEVWASEGGPGVSCDFREAVSEDDLEAGYTALIGVIARCLPSWTRKAENGRKHLVKGTEFTKASMTVRLEIVEKTSRRHPGFQLTIWIDKDTDNN